MSEKFEVGTEAIEKLQEVKDYLEGALYELKEHANYLERAGFPAHIHGQLVSYFVNNVQSFLDNDRQPGSLEGLINKIQAIVDDEPEDDDEEDDDE